MDRTKKKANGRCSKSSSNPWIKEEEPIKDEVVKTIIEPEIESEIQPFEAPNTEMRIRRYSLQTQSFICCFHRLNGLNC